MVYLLLKNTYMDENVTMITTLPRIKSPVEQPAGPATPAASSLIHAPRATPLQLLERILYNSASYTSKLMP
jgi:hypothetical protein